MHGNQWVLKIAVLKYYSVSKRGTTAKSNPKQATDPISLHTKFGDNSSNTFPLNERKPCVTPDIGRRTSDGEKSKNNISTPQGGGHNKRVISTFKFGHAHFTLNEGQKVKSGHARRFPAHDFLYVGIPSKTSRTSNKRVISTFKFGFAHLTLKEKPKVKSDNTKRFPAHIFLYVGIPSQISRTNNKRVISTLNFAYPRSTLNEGPKVFALTQ